MNGLLLSVSRRALAAAGPPVVDVSFVDKATFFKRIPEVNAAPTARFWRLAIYDLNDVSNGFLETGDVQFRTVAGVGESHIDQGTPFSFATYGQIEGTYNWNNEPAHLAFDGTLTTTATFRDGTRGLPFYLGIAFNNPKTVSEVAIYATVNNHRAFKRFVIEYSHDFVTWHLAREYRDQTGWTASAYRLFSTFLGTSTVAPVAAGGTLPAVPVNFAADGAGNPANSFYSPSVGITRGSGVITETATTEFHYLFTTTDTDTDYTVGTTWTLEYEVKPNGANSCQVALLAAAFTTNAWANFDLAAGDFGIKGTDNSLTRFIEPLDNGYFRVGISATVETGVNDSTMGSLAFCQGDNPDTATRIASYLGNTGKSLLVRAHRLYKGVPLPKEVF